ncbi:hypothetical protein K439DRAFT_1658476 [Ramaria rubella]|nr:hypothetical protein K439DRAFT_1658476 [Ramaria rubella]
MNGALQVLILASFALVPVAATTSAPNWLPQSWFFDWTPPGAPLPIPTTAQCETIHVAWQRGTATGPDPVAPYYFQVYTSYEHNIRTSFINDMYSSNYIFPFIIPAGSNPQADLTIPFSPGTQYQICMFDANGNTGGCQAVYTVYSNATSPPTCTNWTMPSNTLSVKSEASQGALSMYGWVDSCSDIRLTPQGGTPPFTFTVAPALHPPLNITSKDMSPINWTVTLSWASPFFISLVDSTGLSWSNGPIHSGDGSTGCLAASDSLSQTPHTSIGVTVGATVGGAALGVLLSLLIACFVSKRRATTREREAMPFDHYNYLASQSTPPLDGRSLLQQQSLSARGPPSHPRTLSGASTGTLPREYDVEPFLYDGNPALRHSVGNRDPSQASRQSWHDTHDALSPNASATVPLPERTESPNQVYVIHHDSGRAPVSVITSRGTEVVELPPGYSSEYITNGGTEGPRSARRQRKTASGVGEQTRRRSECVPEKSTVTRSHEVDDIGS